MNNDDDYSAIYNEGFEAGRRAVFQDLRDQRTRLVNQIRLHEEKLDKARTRHDMLVTVLDMFTEGELS